MEKNDDLTKSAERLNFDLIAKNAFQKYYKKWKEETRFLSSSDAMFENSNYQEIIKMGLRVVPWIIEQLREKPSHLFMALRSITGATPVRPEHVGRLYDMAADWIEWYDNPENNSFIGIKKKK
jgi:hypothetical protein